MRGKPQLGFKAAGEAEGEVEAKVNGGAKARANTEVTVMIELNIECKVIMIGLRELAIRADPCACGCLIPNTPMLPMHPMPQH